MPSPAASELTGDSQHHQGAANWSRPLVFVRLVFSRRILLLLLPAAALGLLLPRLTPEPVLLAALCRGLFFPDDDTIVDDLQLGRAAAARLDALPLDSRLQLRGDLRSLDLGIALLIGARLSSAPPGEIRLALQHLRNTSRGPALARLQELCALACYGHPNLLAELGYAGPPP